MPPVIPVAILCGGKGTRMTGHDATLPKPLVEIGGRPILWHVMSIYAAHGLNRFILLCGHGHDQVDAFASSTPPEWDVSCIDTGLYTPTGGRVARARDLLEGGTFCLTYADGVADIDLDALLGFHRDERAAATMTVVQPQNPWGVARLEGDRVGGFAEKPPLDCWVNGGFFVMEPRALDLVGSGARSTVLAAARCSSGRRSRRWRRPASSPRSATKGSGTAWIPTRTRCCS